jgi:hypothetical protein
MKLIIVFALITFFAIPAFSQINLQRFNTERTDITKTGMLVLGSWGTANIIVGAIGQSSSNSETRFFNQMNLIWGAVNLVIAAPTYFSLNRKSQGLSLSESVKQQSIIEKTFLFNAGLDLVYMTSGLYCMEKGNNDSKHDLYKGYGKSLLVQGGSLLLFDITMYLTNIHHGKKLYKILSSLQISGNCVGLVWKL